MEGEGVVVGGEGEFEVAKGAEPGGGEGLGGGCAGGEEEVVVAEEGFAGDVVAVAFGVGGGVVGGFGVDGGDGGICAVGGGEVDVGVDERAVVEDEACGGVGGGW